MSLLAWLPRIGRAVLVLFGADDAEKLAAAMQRDLDRMGAELKREREIRADELVRMEAQIHDLEAELATWKERALAHMDTADRLDSLHDGPRPADARPPKPVR